MTVEPHVVPVMAGPHVRIGLVSDTHLPESRHDLWPQAYEALAGADVIIHGGDIHEIHFLDQPSEIAPTFAARGNGEEGSGGRPVQPNDDRVRPVWILDVAGALIGVTHDVSVPEYPPHATLAPELDRLFGRRDLDVLVHGHTHVEGIHVVESILCVNPGSPTYPHNLLTQPGTVGELIIEDGSVRAAIWQLTDDGVEPFDWKQRDCGDNGARPLRGGSR